LALDREKIGERGVDPFAPGSGESHTHTATILHSALPLDESGRFQPVDTVGHRPAGDQGLGT